MYCSGHFRALFLVAAILLPGAAYGRAHRAQTPDKSPTTKTSVHLHWGSRSGVARYRLQLATDNAFGDIVFDRVVSGNEYRIDDLAQGRYFWRIAALTDRLGEFSSAGVVEVRAQNVREDSATQDTRPLRTIAPVEIETVPPEVNRAGGGWRAAVGDIARPMLAHLRSATRFDVVGVNSDGVIFALDAASGVSLWSIRRAVANATKGAPQNLLLLHTRSGLDNLVIWSGVNLTAIDGANGHELWRNTLPAAAASGTVVGDGRAAEILLIDYSSSHLLILNATNGDLLAEVRLPHRVLGAPVEIAGQGAGRIILAYETGQIEIRDLSGALLCAGDAGSPAMTPPIFVRGRRGSFILVGTRAGLTALTADRLSPLGMVTTKDDSPRGTLAAEDLDGDGSPEVIMTTSRGRVIAVSADDGKILWEASVGNESQAIAFADIDGDRVLDVFLTGGQTFALALSGRNGAVVWQDREPPALAANHSAPAASRSIIAMPYGSGTLLIAEDPSRTGLRAIEFPKGSAPARH